MKTLNTTSVYKDSRWYDLLFSYNSQFRYYSYINTKVFLETGEIRFKQAYRTHNKGKPSKVGQHILERNSLIEVYPEGTKMNYKENTVVVTTSANDIKGFNTEEDALEWIEDKLDNFPKCKFKMFKPYQEIAPKRRSLADLITKIIA